MGCCQCRDGEFDLNYLISALTSVELGIPKAMTTCTNEHASKADGITISHIQNFFSHCKIPGKDILNLNRMC